jgi:hypothetical protein
VSYGYNNYHKTTKGPLVAIFMITLISGLFFGIKFKTGTDISPDKLLLQTSETVVQGLTEENPISANSWYIFKVAFSIVGLVGLIEFVGSLVVGGPLGLIVGICSYLGAVLLIIIPHIGIWLLIIGAFIAIIGDNSNL